MGLASFNRMRREQEEKAKADKSATPKVEEVKERKQKAE